MLFFIGFYAKADHYAGGELSYECLGPVTGGFEYEVTLTVYRDCTGEI